MDKQLSCYCGLYCGYCAVKVKVGPAAKVLYDEMISAGFEDVISDIPGGEGFWPFLKHMAEQGMCVSCRDGGGNPECAIRLCAQDKEVEMCAFCTEYPCGKLTEFFKSSVGCAVLEKDNVLLRDKGWEAWAELQDKRLENGYKFGDTE